MASIMESDAVLMNKPLKPEDFSYTYSRNGYDLLYKGHVVLQEGSHYRCAHDRPEARWYKEQAEKKIRLILQGRTHLTYIVSRLDAERGAIMTWEEEVQERKRKEAEQEAQNLVVAQTVAILLGGVVLPCPPDREYGYNNYFTVTFDDGRGIALAFDKWGNKGRIEVSGEYPRDTRNHAKRITVSADKTPQKIAKDITNRFLPEYNRTHEEAMKIHQERLDCEAKRNAVRADLLSIPGLTSANYNDQIYIRTPHVSGTVTYCSADGTCSVELRRVPVALLKKFLGKEDAT